MSSDDPLFQKWACPPKLVFGISLKNIAFYENIVHWKILKTSFRYKKDYIDFCRYMPPSPQNSHVLPQMVFHRFFRKYRAFRTATSTFALPAPNDATFSESPHEAAVHQPSVNISAVIFNTYCHLRVKTHSRWTILSINI